SLSGFLAPRLGKPKINRFLTIQAPGHPKQQTIIQIASPGFLLLNRYPPKARGINIRNPRTNIAVPATRPAATVIGMLLRRAAIAVVRTDTTTSSVAVSSPYNQPDITTLVGQNAQQRPQNRAGIVGPNRYR